MGRQRRLLFLLGSLGMACATTTTSLEARPTASFPVPWGSHSLESINSSSSSPVASARVEPSRAATSPRARAPYASALIAVLDFKDKLKGKDADAVDAPYFSNAVRTIVKQTFREVRIMTRENILVMLQASGKSLADCEGECEVDTARRLGADLVISGDLLKIGKLFKLDLRMHETREGQLLNGATASGSTPEELDVNTHTAVETLLTSIR